MSTETRRLTSNNPGIDNPASILAIICQFHDLIDHRIQGDRRFSFIAIANTIKSKGWWGL